MGVCSNKGGSPCHLDYCFESFHGFMVPLLFPFLECLHEKYKKVAKLLVVICVGSRNKEASCIVRNICNKRFDISLLSRLLTVLFFPLEKF